MNFRALRNFARLSAITGAALATTFGLGMTSQSAAFAYGTNHLYELTFSANCDNPAVPLCSPSGFGLGGTWGWIEIDGTWGATSGYADATITQCSHQTPGLPNRAFHTNLSDTPWVELPGSAFLTSDNPPFPVDFPGSLTELYFVIPAAGLAFPVVPGHYSVSAAPGVQVQSQVTQLHS
jgi:hypothetical protein